MNRWILPLSLAMLAACNSGGIGIADGTDTGDGPITTCDGHPFTLRVDSATVAPDTAGFDIDAHDTVSTSDPVGCGKVDASGGIDNALAGLAPTVANFGFDLDTALSDAIQSGNLMIDITVSGYDGGDDDSCVLIDASQNGQTVTTSVEGVIEGGVLKASLPTLELAGQLDAGSGPQTVDINVRDVTLEFPLSGAPEAPVVTGGLLGGGIPWDEAGDQDLRALVLANLPSYIPPSMADGLVSQALDLLPDGSASGSCDALSSALTVHATGL